MCRYKFISIALFLMCFLTLIERSRGGDDDDSPKNAEIKPSAQRRNLPLDDAEYEALFSILTGQRCFQDWPKKQNSALRQRVYKKWMSGEYEVREIHEPLNGRTTSRIVHKKSESIVVKKSEISSVIENFFVERKGEGAVKLSSCISHVYRGISRKCIQSKLNVMKEPQKVRPLFQNKAPLRPIKAKKVQERHQVDLVSMIGMPVTTECGKTYKYIMSVIDIFSRFVFLRPLASKQSAEVAIHLLEIYSEHGPPEILQSDQGTEFKGVVKSVCESLNVRIIKSSAYHPQTQGKDERSHRTWKEKLQFDILNCNDDLNWVERLSKYQQLYNESPHSSLAMLSPFEVYYGRPANTLKRKLSLGQKVTFEVPEEGAEEVAQFHAADDPDLKVRMQDLTSIRKKALRGSDAAAERMVKRELKRNPPSLYFKGEKVLIRIAKARKTVKGKKASLRRTCEWVILEADHTNHKYLVQYDGSTNPSIWVKVDDITSLTKEEENEKQKAARSSLSKKSEKDLDLNEVREVGRNVSIRNVSVLDASIEEILANRKFSGDTMNLYFDFLRQKGVWTATSFSLASSYFYPSLMREPTTYRKHIGNDALRDFEHLVVPINLPKEDHWLLAVLSVVSLCIYIYDSYDGTDGETYRMVFNTLKNNFISKERQYLTENRKEELHEQNWTEKIQTCPKQKNITDCGLFTCLFTKNLLTTKFVDCNSPNGMSRSEIVSDLCELASASTNHNDTAQPSYVPDWLFSEPPLDIDNEMSKLDIEVASAGLAYRQPPTPKDGNCLFHAISDQLVRLRLPAQTASELRANLVEFLRRNPTTPDGHHLKEFVAYNAWESYLRKMSQPGEWGDWITLWGLINMLSIDVAVVSSLGKTGLRIISPSSSCAKTGSLEGMALLGHEAEAHYHSLEPDILTDGHNINILKAKYGEGEVTEEVCTRCNKLFQSVSAGVHVHESGAIQCYSDDQSLCDLCQYEEFHPVTD